MQMKTRNQNIEVLPEGYKPKVTDILCGRGRSFVKHGGNKKFSVVVRENMKRYMQGRNRSYRSRIVASIVGSLEQEGDRFIKQDGPIKRYCELNSDAAHEKTGHAIRDLIKLNCVFLGRKPRSFEHDGISFRLHMRPTANQSTVLSLGDIFEENELIEIAIDFTTAEDPLCCVDKDETKSITDDQVAFFSLMKSTFCTTVNNGSSTEEMGRHFKLLHSSSDIEDDGLLSHQIV